jgi:hypothetical protein
MADRIERVKMQPPEIVGGHGHRGIEAIPIRIDDSIIIDTYCFVPVHGNGYRTAKERAARIVTALNGTVQEQGGDG